MHPLLLPLKSGKDSVETNKSSDVDPVSGSRKTGLENSKMMT